MNKKRLMIIVSIVSVILLSSCVPPHFNLKDDKYVFKNKDIAIVAGSQQKVAVLYAAQLALSLREISQFNVMLPKQVIKKIPGYPMKVRGPWKTANLGDIDVDYSNTDLRRVKFIQQKLGVKYVYFVWVPDSVEWIMGGSKAVEIFIMTQLFEFPGAKEIANAKYSYSYVAGGLHIGGTRDPEKALAQSCDYAAKKIAEKTGMLKK
jgi:hypothetical protein